MIWFCSILGLLLEILCKMKTISHRRFVKNAATITSGIAVFSNNAKLVSTRIKNGIIQNGQVHGTKKRLMSDKSAKKKIQILLITGVSALIIGYSLVFFNFLKQVNQFL